MSHHIVEVRDLKFNYPDLTPALCGVSFKNHHGESVAIVGANGAGKRIDASGLSVDRYADVALPSLSDCRFFGGRVEAERHGNRGEHRCRCKAWRGRSPCHHSYSKHFHSPLLCPRQSAAIDLERLSQMPHEPNEKNVLELC